MRGREETKRGREETKRGGEETKRERGLEEGRGRRVGKGTERERKTILQTNKQT